MPYNADQTWTILANGAGATARMLSKYLREAQAEYEEWLNFRNSRTDTQIATALGRTEAEIADLDACYAAFTKIYSFADNDASPVQADHFFAMRKFS